jgi:hypothetical protein
MKNLVIIGIIGILLFSSVNAVGTTMKTSGMTSTLGGSFDLGEITLDGNIKIESHDGGMVELDKLEGDTVELTLKVNIEFLTFGDGVLSYIKVNGNEIARIDTSDVKTHVLTGTVDDCEHGEVLDVKIYADYHNWYSGVIKSKSHTLELELKYINGDISLSFEKPNLEEEGDNIVIPITITNVGKGDLDWEFSHYSDYGIYGGDRSGWICRVNGVEKDGLNSDDLDDLPQGGSVDVELETTEGLYFKEGAKWIQIKITAINSYKPSTDYEDIYFYYDAEDYVSGDISEEENLPAIKLTLPNILIKLANYCPLLKTLL